jgi:D-xylose transport system substrate-binding protein
MLPNMNAMRYEIERKEFTSKMNRFGVDVIFEQADNDEQKQLVQLESLISQGIEIPVLDPVNRFTAAQMVRKAHSKGIKVISYDRLISNSDVDAFISFDPWMTGSQMTEVVTRLKPEGNYIILGGDKADLNAIGIDEGQQKVLEPFIKSGKIKVKYKIFIEKWAADEAFYEVGKFIDLFGDEPDVILASSDVLALGTVNLLKE